MNKIEIINKPLEESDTFQIGLDKIFFRYSEMEYSDYLETEF